MVVGATVPEGRNEALEVTNSTSAADRVHGGRCDIIVRNRGSAAIPRFSVTFSVFDAGLVRVLLCGEKLFETFLSQAVKHCR